MLKTCLNSSQCVASPLWLCNAQDPTLASNISNIEQHINTLSGSHLVLTRARYPIFVQEMSNHLSRYLPALKATFQVVTIHDELEVHFFIIAKFC